jgi:hypothetical protein
MKEYLPIVFAIMAGCCLTIIAIKNKLPFFGGLLSPKLKIQLSKTDKYLALMALLFFGLSLSLLVMWA